MATAQGRVVALTADSTRVCWVTADGAVPMVSTSGGEVVELAKGIAAPTGVTLGPDATS